MKNHGNPVLATYCNQVTNKWFHLERQNQHLKIQNKNTYSWNDGTKILMKWWLKLSFILGSALCHYIHLLYWEPGWIRNRILVVNLSTSLSLHSVAGVSAWTVFMNRTASHSLPLWNGGVSPPQGVCKMCVCFSNMNSASASSRKFPPPPLGRRGELPWRSVSYPASSS